MLTFDTALVAERIKECRERKKLTQQETVDLLQSEYGIPMSLDTLKNFESTKGTRGGRNRGMRIEYLFYLSQLFGVSTDYLIGKSSMLSTNDIVKAIGKHTGLNEEAIGFIMDAKNGAGHRMHECYNFLIIINHLFAYKKTMIKLLFRNLRKYAEGLTELKNKLPTFIENVDKRQEHYSLRYIKGESETERQAKNRRVTYNYTTFLLDAVKHGIEGVPIGFSSDFIEIVQNIRVSRYDAEKAFDVLIDGLTEAWTGEYEKIMEAINNDKENK